MKYLYWAARIVAALIMLQTLFFKFSGAEESIYIFTTVGMEPWGRYLVGTGELFAAMFLLVPRTVWLGGLLTVGLMLGAIGMHLTLLGIVVFDDGGQLFIYACVTLVLGAFALSQDKASLISFLNKLKGK